MGDINDLKSNVDWALLYQGILEQFAATNVASYSVGGSTFTRNNIEFYQRQYEKYVALARLDDLGGGAVALVDFRS